MAGGGEGNEVTDAVLRIWELIELDRFGSASSMRA